MGNRDIQEAQKKILGRLSRIAGIRELEFYLAGGTGLNLQMQHRLSVDEDFFTSKKFDPQELLQLLSNHFHVIEPQKSKGTLHCFLDGIRCSFFSYPYPLLNPPIIKIFPIASLLDIATMKLSAIVGRGAKKDFYDLYCLLTQQIDFETVWQAYQKKYSTISEDIYPVLKSLAYFDDAEAEKLEIDNEDDIWKNVKEFFTNLSKKVMKKLS
jgi:hypothetical protein